MASHLSKKISLKIRILKDISDILGEHSETVYDWVTRDSSIDEIDEVYLKALIDIFGGPTHETRDTMNVSFRYAGRHLMYGLRALLKIQPDIPFQSLRDYMICLIDEQLHDFEVWLTSIGQYFRVYIDKEYTYASEYNS